MTKICALKYIFTYPLDLKLSSSGGNYDSSNDSGEKAPHVHLIWILSLKEISPFTKHIYY